MHTGVHTRAHAIPLFRPRVFPFKGRVDTLDLHALSYILAFSPPPPQPLILERSR